MREGGEGEEFRRRWLSVALAYFHGLPKEVGRRVPIERVTTQGDVGFIIVWNEKEYWVPKAASRLAAIP